MRPILANLIILLLLAPAVTPALKAQSLGEDPRVASALDLLEVWLEAQRAYEDIPGLSMAVVHDQEVLWQGAFGYADRARDAKATPQTIYSICSISKLFTSIAVMQLRDQGALHLDDRVAKHLSWFNIEQIYPESSPVTVEGLLTHSAGLPRESDYPYWRSPFDFPTREMVIERLGEQEMLYPASKYFQYSNLGLTLAGEIVAAASGQPYSDYIQEKILVPLGLDDTSPEIPKAERGKRFAMGYGGRGREGERAELPFFQVEGIAPAAGFASTVEDLSKFASWQFRVLEENSDDVLKANTLREMHRVHWVDPDWEVHWGLGFATWRSADQTFVGHGGGCPGFRSHLLLQPEGKFAAVVMTNAIDVSSNMFTRVAHQIVAPAVKEALDAPGEGKEPDPTLAMYVGTYALDWGGELAVLPWKDGLAMLYLPTDDPRDALVKLKKTGEHVFRRVRDDGALGEEISFEVENGRVVRLWRHSNYMEKAP